MLKIGKITVLNIVARVNNYDYNIHHFVIFPTYLL